MVANVFLMLGSMRFSVGVTRFDKTIAALLLAHERETKNTPGSLLAFTNANTLEQ